MDEDKVTQKTLIISLEPVEETNKYSGLPTFDPSSVGADPISQSSRDTTLNRKATTEIADITLKEKRSAEAKGNLTLTLLPYTKIEPQEANATKMPGDLSWGIDAIGAKEKYDETVGTGVKVAVLDTGIDLEHPAFDGPVKPQVMNFTQEEDEDRDGHGTHCAGTIFGQDVGGVRIGVALGIREPLIAKVLGEGGGTSQTIYEALTWAQREGAHVVSMSLGIDFPKHLLHLLDEKNLPLKMAVSLALSGYRENLRFFDGLARQFISPGEVQTPLLIAAAGNASDRPYYDIGTEPPAVANFITSVGAVDENLRVAAFSNSGADLSAPGVNIWSADAKTEGLVAKSGTSMATPHVAGVAIAHAQKLIEENVFTADRLRQRLMGQVTDLNDPIKDVGEGMVRA